MSGVSRRFGVGVMATVFVMGMVLGVTPVMAQGNSGGPQTIEPTLAECRAFVEENGVPETRPLQPNRGYSGWDVCLNMAYDGDLEGYFVSADTDGDGVLGASEQRAYLDSVVGPVSDPDVSPLTVEKCEALVAENGIPEDRPFVDWGNRGYGEVEICQAMAYDGDLAGDFASWDANGDGRMDRSEQSAAVEGLSGRSGEVAEQPMTSLTLDACDAYIRERGLPGADPLFTYEGGSRISYNIAVCQSIGISGDLAGGFVAWDANGDGILDTGESGAYAESVTGAPVEQPTPGEGAADGQYKDTGAAAAPEDTIPEDTGMVGSGSDAQEQTTTDGSSGSAASSGEPEEQGVLSAVTQTVGGILPDSGGAALASIVAAAALILGGGFLAYRSFRG